MPREKAPQPGGKSTEKREQPSEAHKEAAPMQLEVRIHSIRPSDSIKGTASVNINGAFAVRGIKIIEGSNGLFVSPAIRPVMNTRISVSPSRRSAENSFMMQ